MNAIDNFQIGHFVGQANGHFFSSGKIFDFCRRVVTSDTTDCKRQESKDCVQSADIDAWALHAIARNGFGDT